MSNKRVTTIFPTANVDRVLYYLGHFLSLF